jgi:glutamate 5-kinase
LVIDDGAVKVLQGAGRSLLPVGVTEVRGRFARGELVRCIDVRGKEIARGLVNYDYREAAQIIGAPSERIESILGYVDEPEIIHRDNMVVL